MTRIEVQLSEGSRAWYNSRMNEVCAKMKRRVLGLVLCGLGAFSLSATGNPSEDDVLRRYVEKCGFRASHKVQRLTGERALRVVDDVFSRGEGVDETLLCWLRRLLSEGRAEMFSYETSYGKDPCRCYDLIDTMPEVLSPENVDPRDPAPSVRKDGNPEFQAFAYPLPNPTHTDVGGTCYFSQAASELAPPVRPFALSEVRVEDVSREVVADIETVRLESLTHLDAQCFAADESEDEDSPYLAPARACYRVTMRIREVRKGACDFKRFSFPVLLRGTTLTPKDKWLFFRGMTLSVGFSSSDGVERVSRIDPVVPYPPYAKEGVRVIEEDRVLVGDYQEASELFDFGHSFPDETRPWEVVLDYAGHTYARYLAPSNLISGVFGDFPDLNTHVQIQVRTDGEGADPDYWRYAWFAVGAEKYQPAPKIRESGRVEVRPALDCFEDYDYGAFEFSLRGIRLPSVSICPPATMADVADFFTLALKPMGAGRRHFALTADVSCAARPVRPYMASDVEALKALKAICTMNGCKYDVEGTNVVIAAELPESDLMPPDLDGIVRELGSDGFAALRGATNTATSIRFMDAPLRLKRDIAQLIFRLEEDRCYVNDELVLLFAFQVYAEGYRAEAERIVSLLWRDPMAAKRMLQAVRERVKKEVRGDSE